MRDQSRMRKSRQAAVMWIRDGVLINRMPINAVAFAYAYILSCLQAEDSLTVSSLVNFAFEQSGSSCLEKMALLRSQSSSGIGSGMDIEAASRLYNQLASEAAHSASYFDGALDLLRWLRTCKASSFITSAVEQEVLDEWARSAQGRKVSGKPGLITEILGRRPNFCKGRDHFQYVSDWLTESFPEPETVKTIYYIADAVSEIRQGREFTEEFSIVPIGFANYIDNGQVQDAASLVQKSLEKLIASGRVDLASPQANLTLDASQLQLPSWGTLEANLRQAGAVHVVRNFAELRAALDPHHATFAINGKNFKARPMKPITMVVWALAMVTSGLICWFIFGIVFGFDRGTPQLIEYATHIVDSKRLRYADKNGQYRDFEYGWREVRKLYLDNELVPGFPPANAEGAKVESPFQFNSEQIRLRRHATTELNDGRIFISGGVRNEHSVAFRGYSTESFKSNQTFFYDPNTAAYSSGPSLLQPRAGHTMITLKDGRVLIAGGGWPERSANILEVEIFDPNLNLLSPAGRLSVPRENYGIAQLGNGKILFVGGRTADSYSDAAEHLTSTIELYDLRTGGSTVVGQLRRARQYPDICAIGDSGALIVGGNTGCYFDVLSDASIRVVEYYDGSRTSSAAPVPHILSFNELIFRLLHLKLKI